MALLPKALNSVIEALSQLPGVGPRSAERYAYYLLKRDPAKSKKLAEALQSLHAGVAYCPVTFTFVNTGEDISPLYVDPERDKTIVAVVADPFDVVAIEKTGVYAGTYHVLGGLISPIDGINPDDLHIVELLMRVANDNVKEIILATNASVEGETTALYLQKQLQDSGVAITRLARGLSVGVDLEYADQISLGRAFEGRQII